MRKHYTVTKNTITVDGKTLHSSFVLNDIDLQTLWAIFNDCYDGEVQTCDDCGMPVSEELSSIWTDVLVVCSFCTGEIRIPEEEAHWEEMHDLLPVPREEDQG